MVQMPPTADGSKLELNALECYLDSSTNEVSDVVVHSAFSEQKWVWLEDKDEGYLPGQIISESQNQQSVQVALNDGQVSKREIQGLGMVLQTHDFYRFEL